MSIQPGGSSRQPTRGRPRRGSIGLTHWPDPSALAASSARRYETRDSNLSKRFLSEGEDVDDGGDDDDDGASNMSEESGVVDEREGMLMNQRVLKLAEETPRSRRTHTLMTQHQLTILHALLAKVSISYSFGTPSSFSS